MKTKPENRETQEKKEFIKNDVSKLSNADEKMELTQEFEKWMSECINARMWKNLQNGLGNKK